MCLQNRAAGARRRCRTSRQSNRIQALKTTICAPAQLLGEILLDPANAKTMMRFVSDAENLKLMMVLLKDSSKSIQFEAFHVFKVRIESGCQVTPCGLQIRTSH